MRCCGIRGKNMQGENRQFSKKTGIGVYDSLLKEGNRCERMETYKKSMDIGGQL